MGAARPAINALLADQRSRWRAGDRVTVEQLVAAHPSLADHPDALLDLIYAVVLFRRAAGDSAPYRLGRVAVWEIRPPTE